MDDFNSPLENCFICSGTCWFVSGSLGLGWYLNHQGIHMTHILADLITESLPIINFIRRLKNLARTCDVNKITFHMSLVSLAYL